MQKRIIEWLELVLGVDVRSLAFFRMMLGGVILLDLYIRFNSLEAHYTDDGILPRWVLSGISENPLLLSLNMLSGGSLWQIVIFTLAICSTILFIIGYRTRLATVATSILMLSIHVRNPFVNNLGDWFLLHLLFWSILLPLGAAFSVDAKMKKTSYDGSPIHLSVASMGVVFQIASLYFFSIYYKISPIWHTESSAIYYALSLDRLTTPGGEYILLLSPVFLEWLTQGTMILERWGPVMLFFPFITAQIRLLVAFCFIAFHLGLMFTMALGVFPLVCIAAWILIIPSQFWDTVRARFKLIGEAIRNHDSLISGENKKSTVNWLETFISVCLIWVMLSSNLLHTGNMSEAYYERSYKYVEPLVNSLNLRQRWNMFSPHPSKQDGWFLVLGIQQNGKMINLIDEGIGVDWRRPLDISATYRSQRWRKNFEWVMMRWDPHGRLMATYMKSRWNSIHTGQEAVEKVFIIFMSEYTQDGYRSTPTERKLLYEL